MPNFDLKRHWIDAAKTLRITDAQANVNTFRISKPPADKVRKSQTYEIDRFCVHHGNGQFQCQPVV